MTSHYHPTDTQMSEILYAAVTETYLKNNEKLLRLKPQQNKPLQVVFNFTTQPMEFRDLRLIEITEEQALDLLSHVFESQEAEFLLENIERLMRYVVSDNTLTYYNANDNLIIKIQSLACLIYPDSEDAVLH